MQKLNVRLKALELGSLKVELLKVDNKYLPYMVRKTIDGECVDRRQSGTLADALEVFEIATLIN
jgi:hypothetical protein